MSLQSCLCRKRELGKGDSEDLAAYMRQDAVHRCTISLALANLGSLILSWLILKMFLLM